MQLKVEHIKGFPVGKTVKSHLPLDVPMRLVIRGTVQGVGFRPTVYRVARSMGLNGYVKNKGSMVEVVIDGDPKEFMDALRSALPPLAKITEVGFHDEDMDIPQNFHIVRSEEGERSSSIPVDTALCERCIQELRSEKNRRRDFPFINCTDCGARYSAIKGLPYDRPNTTMSPFHMCERCSDEYADPTDRRFHAQTLSCHDCGPHYVLFDRDRKKLGGVPEFAALIERGDIAVAKGWGGMHIICRLESIPELRHRYGRPYKPFALMMRDLETACRYTHVTREDVLTGPRKPIMIYPKKDDRLDDAAPGLHTVGVMLPYTALHYILFDLISVDTLVMTSANIPGEPMVVSDKEVFELDFDHFLLHNRKIAQRVDDSLIRVHNQHLAPIRRSRGYVPEYIPFREGPTVFGAGADESGSVSISVGDKLYPSQYLGALGSYQGVSFYKQTVEHLTRLLGIEEIEAVAVDLHPSYQSRKLGIALAEDFGARVMEVQHHWAHGASILLEHDLDDVVCIAIDGTGYGDDGGSWGGEILHCTPRSYQRKAHLEPFPLLGGEEAVKDPRRLFYAIARTRGSECDIYPQDKGDIFDKLMSDSVYTTSFGRLLDAVSAALGVCSKRTYQGEPAMKLEKLQATGSPDRTYDVRLEGDTIYTLDGFMEMVEDTASPANRAASYTSSVSKVLAEAAAVAAEETNSPICISGGVSYNEPIVGWIRERLGELGHGLIVHEVIPNGDMGISLGQAFVASQCDR